MKLPDRRYTMKLPDRRYTVSRELCGYPTPIYVARFCGRLLSVHATEDDAVTAIWDYHEERMSGIRS